MLIQHKLASFNPTIGDGRPRSAVAATPASAAPDEVQLSESAPGPVDVAPWSRLLGRCLSVGAPVGLVVSQEAGRQLEELFAALNRKQLNFHLNGRPEPVEPKELAGSLELNPRPEVLGLSVSGRDNHRSAVHSWQDLKALEGLYLSHEFEGLPQEGLLRALDHLQQLPTPKPKMTSIPRNARRPESVGLYQAYKALSGGHTPILVGHRSAASSPEEFQELAFFDYGSDGEGLAQPQLARRLQRLEQQHFTFHQKQGRTSARRAWRSATQGGQVELGFRGAPLGLTIEAEPEQIEHHSQRYKELYSAVAELKPTPAQFARIAKEASGRVNTFLRLASMHPWGIDCERACDDLRAIPEGPAEPDLLRSVKSVGRRLYDLHQQMALEQPNVSLNSARFKASDWGRRDYALVMDGLGDDQTPEQAAELLCTAHRQVSRLGGPEAGQLLFTHYQRRPELLGPEFQKGLHEFTQTQEHLCQAASKPPLAPGHHRVLSDACRHDLQVILDSAEPNRGLRDLNWLHRQLGAPRGDLHLGRAFLELLEEAREADFDLNVQEVECAEIPPLDSAPMGRLLEAQAARLQGEEMQRCAGPFISDYRSARDGDPNLVAACYDSTAGLLDVSASHSLVSQAQARNLSIKEWHDFQPLLEQHRRLEQRPSRARAVQGDVEFLLSLERPDVELLTALRTRFDQRLVQTPQLAYEVIQNRTDLEGAMRLLERVVELDDELPFVEHERRFAGLFEHADGPQAGLRALHIEQLVGSAVSEEAEVEYCEDAIGIGDFQVMR